MAKQKGKTELEKVLSKIESIKSGKFSATSIELIKLQDRALKLKGGM